MAKQRGVYRNRKRRRPAAAPRPVDAQALSQSFTRRQRRAPFHTAQVAVDQQARASVASGIEVLTNAMRQRLGVFAAAHRHEHRRGALKRPFHIVSEGDSESRPTFHRIEKVQLRGLRDSLNVLELTYFGIDDLLVHQDRLWFTSFSSTHRFKM